MDINALRAQTPGCAGRIHLNNAGAALLAQPTLDAMIAQLRREAEIGSATWDGQHGFTWAPGAQRFATWEHSYVNVLGLGARLRGQLAGLPGVTVHDPGQVRCAIVTAKIDGVAAEQAAQALERAGVNVSTTVPEHNPLDTQDRGVHPLIRFSPHYYNTEEEVDRTTELVAALAS